MALVLKDRVRESSTSSGTGSITLAGAYTGYQTFSSVVASGSTVYYTIHNTTSPNDGEWEVGVGTFTSPSTLSRDTVLSSSAGGVTKVNFSTASVLEVFITQPAGEAVYINDATGKVEAFGNGTNSISFTTVVADTVTLTSGTISTNAANATDITNKQYVDGLFSTGISYHEPVLVESPTSLNAVYVQPNGAGNGVGATLTNNGANVALVLDGVTVSNTARVLVYTQANAVQNGIYTVTNPGAPDSPGPGAKWVLTRATDADTYGLADPNALGAGDAVFVQSGNTGAGETYVCNTPGTITFGSTNITFAQISTAQIYSAGTGLNLSNLTFSIANTTVVTGLYGDSANVAVIEVNPQGQLTSASNSAINVSNITVGTLSNDRTTANSSNGANTIVLRDSTGSFNANVVTATTGNFSSITANAAGLTDINASNITSGTISNDRTTGSTSNSANTIVLRDASGNFGSNVISASLFSGDGSAINAINASNISSGTIANARTTASASNGASTIVLRDANGDFAADAITANFFIGDGSNVSAINGSNVTTGTIANARTTASSSNGASTIVLRDAGGAFAAGAITATSLSGNGASITAINASAITTGTLDNARTSASSANGASTIVARDAGGNFSANTITATTFSGAFSGNGATISAINASNISSGTVATARLASGTANSSTYLRGDQTWAALSAPNNGTLTMNTSGTGISGSATFTADQSGNTTFTVASNASSANGASTLVARDSGGNFSANTITANLTGTASSATSATTATQVSNSVTFNNGGGGGASGSTFNGSGALTVSYNTIGAPSTTGTNASGTWGISISGSAASATTATTATNWGAYGAVPAAGTSFGNANTIGRSDANGYAYFSYINSNTSNNENPTVSQVIVTNGGDNFYRKASIAHLTSSLSGTASSLTAGSANALNTGNNYQVNSIGVGAAASGTAGRINATTGVFTPNTTGVSTGLTVVNGDLTSYRSGGTTGVVYLSSSGSHYLYWDGTNYNLNSGNLICTGNITAFSDEKLKKNWRHLSPKFVYELAQVKSGVYDRVDQEITQVGVSAQSLQKIMPEAVLESNDGTLSVAYGSAALAACVELAKEVVRLREELDALKGK